MSTISTNRDHAGRSGTQPGLGFFFRMSLPYSGWMALGLFLSCATFAAGLGLAGVSGGFLTATAIAGLSIQNAQAFNVFLPSAGIRFFAIGRTAGRWLERVVSHDATFRVIGTLRVWLYRKLSRLSPRQLGGIHSADVLNRLTRDIDLLDNLYLRLLLPTIAAVLVLSALAGFVGGVAAVLVWPVLAVLLIATVVVPFLAFRSGFVLSRDLVADQNRLRVSLLDAVDGLEDLALHRASWEKQRVAIAAVDEERLSKQLRFQRRGAIFRAVLVMITGAAVWVLLRLATTSSQGGLWIGGSTFVALVMLLMGTVEVIQALPRAWLELAGTMAAAGRVSALAGQQPSPAFADRQPSPTLAATQPPRFDIRVQDLSFAYSPGVPVLTDIGLTIPEGTHLAVLGPSGGGKSTLAALLARAEAPDSGSIFLGGTELRGFDEPGFRKIVCASTQEPWIFTASIAHNLRLAAPGASDGELLEALRLVGLHDKVSGWPEGLETWIEEGGASLSGGERRRLAAARVLLRDCPVTVLDEATEGLDDAAAEHLVQAVRRHRAGKTLVWISHRPHGIEGFDRIVRIENGRIFEA